MNADFILARLAVSGVEYKIHAHAPSVTYQDAAEYLDFPLERLLKTIAFQVKGGPIVLAAIHGAARVDYKKLATHCQVRRDKLAQLSPEAVEARLGYPLGGVAPFAPDESVQVVFDDGLLSLGQVFCGTGRKDRTLEIVITDLVRVAQGKVAPLVQKTGSG